MIDPVNLYRLAQIRQQEYLEAAEQERNAAAYRVSMTEAVNNLIMRLTALVKPVAPVRTVTAPNITAQPCVEC